MTPMRIILADHHAPLLRVLKLRLLEAPEFEIVGEVVNAESLLTLAEQQVADLVLVDWDLPGRSFEELIASLDALEPRPIVVVMGSNEKYGRRSLRAGANAFVSKTDTPRWLLDTLYGYAARMKK